MTDIVIGIEQLKSLGDVYSKYGNSILRNKITHHIHRGHVVIDVPYFSATEKEIWYICISKSGGYTTRKDPARGIK